MKKSLICSIKNNDLNEFGALMLFPSKKVAIASFLNWLDSQSEKHFDPSDFELYHVGSFDATTGALSEGKVVKLADCDTAFKEK